MERSACRPELERVGSVWPSLTKPHSGLPPTAGQPRFEATASCSTFQVTLPSDLSSASARSSQMTKTSGVITSGCGASALPSGATNSLPVLVVQSDAPRDITSESAGLHSAGFSVPSRSACIASSDPLPASCTSTSGRSRAKAAVAASSQSFFSVL